MSPVTKNIYRAALRDLLREPTDFLLSPLHFGGALARRNAIVGGAQFDPAPRLPPAALAQWEFEVSRCETYLEYGAGGSTLAAAEMAHRVVTVDTDRHFLERVSERITGQAELYPVHVDIGLTRAWGRPLVTLRTRKRLARWRRYPVAPWARLSQLSVLPEVIFVDGRFRVASVLESLLQLPDDADCCFLVDDFEGRERMYWPILEFARSVSRYDRMITFRKTERFDRERCRKMLEYACADPR